MMKSKLSLILLYAGAASGIFLCGCAASHAKLTKSPAIAVIVTGGTQTARGPVPGCDSMQTTSIIDDPISTPLLTVRSSPAGIKTSKPRTCFYGRRSPTLKSYNRTTADGRNRGLLWEIIIKTSRGYIPNSCRRLFRQHSRRNFRCRVPETTGTVPGFDQGPGLRQHAHA